MNWLALILSDFIRCIPTYRYISIYTYIYEKSERVTRSQMKTVHTLCVYRSTELQNE